MIKGYFITYKEHSPLLVKEVATPLTSKKTALIDYLNLLDGTHRNISELKIWKRYTNFKEVDVTLQVNKFLHG